MTGRTPSLLRRRGRGDSHTGHEESDIEERKGRVLVCDGKNLIRRGRENSREGNFIKRRAASSGNLFVTTR